MIELVVKIRKGSIKFITHSNHSVNAESLYYYLDPNDSTPLKALIEPTHFEVVNVISDYVSVDPHLQEDKG